jgi:hypothetical protein
MSATAVLAEKVTSRVRKEHPREAIKREILAALGECDSCCFVSPTASINQMRSGLTKGAYSNTMFKRALGRLIEDGKVIWSRARPQHIGDDERPITLKLALPAVQTSVGKQDSFKPYFA